MEEPFRRFQWQVATAHHWQDWLDQRGRPIVPPTRGLLTLDSPSGVELAWQEFHKRDYKTGPVIGPTSDARTARTYSPMSREHASLFQTFAGLDYTSLTQILDFANAYGLLGLTRQDQGVMVGKAPQRYHHANGESHLDWAREICLMREALDLTRSKSPEEIADDVAAWRRVQMEPPRKERLQKLAWLFNVHLQQVQGRMVFSESGPPQLSFAPLTLLSAMWLQLALSVVGDKVFRACKHCRRLFEISTEQTGFRKHRAFCSASCKTLDYRKRKRTALSLIEEGGSVADVAARSKTPKATVRAWISAKKRQTREGTDVVPTR